MKTPAYANVQSNNAKTILEGMPLNATLDDLDLHALQMLGEYHKRLADKIHAKVSEKKIISERQKETEKENRKLEKDIKHFANLLECEIPYQKALKKVAGNDRLKQNQLEARFKASLKSKTIWAKQARRAAVIRLAQAGMKNYEIAEELGVHRNTVSADIRLTINRDWNPV